MGTSKSSKRLLVNIVAIIVFVIVLVVAVSVALSLVTRHGKYVEVPDMVGMQLEEAEAAAAAAQVRIEVEDSNYVRTVEPGAVYHQDPPAGSQVKKDRHVRLSLNTLTARKVALPNVLDCPLRQAVSELYSKGFSVGRIHYETGYDDRVISIVKGGVDLQPGTMIESGSALDLRVGFNSAVSSASVPSVTGKRATQAAKEIQEHSLNVRISYDSSVRTADDRRKAVVFNQSLAAGSVAVKGTYVTVNLTVDPEKLSN